MDVLVKIILTGLIGFVAFSLLSSFTIDNTADFLENNNIALDQVSTLDMWSGRFLILGIGTLIAFVAIVAPIGELTAIVLLGDFIGGAIAWMLI